MHVTLLRYEGLDPPWHSQRRIRPKLAIHSQSPHCALSLLIFAGLLTVVAIDYPFAGTVKVGPEALATPL